MPSVTDKPNGKCVIRVFCGTDEFGKKIVKSKTFTPSSPNLPYSKYPMYFILFIKIILLLFPATQFELSISKEFNSNIKKTTTWSSFFSI